MRRASFVLGLVSILSGHSASALSWPNAEADAELTHSQPAQRERALREAIAARRSSAFEPALALLADPQPGVRELAAQLVLSQPQRLRERALREQPAADATATAAADSLQLTPWLSDADPNLRALGCQLLRAAYGPDAALALARALSDNVPAVQKSAARELAALAAEGAQGDPVAALLSVLDGGDAEVRASVAQALGAYADARARGPLQARASDSAVPVRLAAVQALTRLPARPDDDPLYAFLRDGAQAVALAALQGLLERPQRPRLEPLLEVLHGATETSRRTALRALAPRHGQAADPAHSRAVWEYARTALERDPEQPLMPLADALRPLPSALEPVLRDALKQPTAIAHLAALALATKHDPAQATELGCWARTRREQGRLDAATARALASELVPSSGGDACVLPLLLEGLQGGSPSERSDGRAALGHYLAQRPGGDGRVVEPLRDALQSSLAPRWLRAFGSDPEAERELIALLGQTRAPAAATALAHTLRTARAAAHRAAAADALRELGALGDDTVTQALVLALDDRVREVRQRAAAALRRRPRALPELQRLFEQARAQRTTPSLEWWLASSQLAADAGAGGRAWLRERRPRTASAERDLWLALAARTELLHGGRDALAAAEDALERRFTEAPAAEQIAVLRGFSGLANAAALGELGLQHANPHVRAEAAALWTSWEEAPSDAVTSRLRTLLQEPGDDAVNAAAALGWHQREPAALCEALQHPRVDVRSNALWGLARSSQPPPCESAVLERLQGAKSPIEAAAAARASARLSPHGAARAQRALCAEHAEALTLRAVCAEPMASAAPPHATSAREPIYVQLAPSGDDAPHQPFVWLDALGRLRAGLTDRGGAVLDPAAPAGVLQLADHRPSR